MEEQGFLSQDNSKRLIGLNQSWTSDKIKDWKTCMEFITKLTLFVDENQSFGYRRTIIEQGINEQDYYCFVDDCNNPRKKIVGGSLGINRFSEVCHLKDEVHKQTQVLYRNKKREESCLTKYVVTHESKLESIKNKKKDTFRKNYGVDNIFSTVSFKHFILDFWRERGVDNPSQLAEVKNKKKNTSMLHFGVPYPMQDPLIFRKCQLSSGKRYTYNSGEHYWVIQGYEKYFLRDALKIHLPTHIYNTDMRCCYTFCGRDRVYYPDFHVNNKVYEIKSIFTYFQDFYKNIAKSKAVKQTGLNHITYTYDPKGELIGIH